MSSVGNVDNLFNYGTSSSACSSNEPSQSPSVVEAFQNLAATSCSSDVSFTATRPTTPEDNYQSLISALSPEQKAEIELTLEKITDADVDDFAKAITDGKPTPVVGLEYPYVALKAVRAGKLSSTEFSTIMIFWATVQTNPSKIRGFGLFSEGDTIDENSRALIKQTLK